MIVQVTLVTALLVVVVCAAGCGSPEKSRRQAVAAYIERANTVQQRAAPAVRQAGAVYAEQARGGLAPARQLRELRHAEAALEGIREELDALSPPPEARRLHDGLLRVLDLDVALTRQTVRLASYAQGAPRILEPLGPAGRRLDRRLKRQGAPEEQAAAIGAYESTLDRMLRGLGRLEVPSVLRPTHEDQVRRLERTRSLARQLRRAAAAADAGRLARLLLRFGKAGGTSVLEERKLAKRGLASYAAQLRRLESAQQRLVREQIRLNREITA
ncbi:MAG: hypothetical protein JWO90_2041 [Solirubrobacterales bacterium]|nr:hypothetical protein [Solirubrobacterales bacterium]